MYDDSSKTRNIPKSVCFFSFCFVQEVNKYLEDVSRKPGRTELKYPVVMWEDPSFEDKAECSTGSQENSTKTHSNFIVDINLKLLNAIRYNILVPLTYLITECVQIGFPIVCKLSKIVPIHKKQSLYDRTNYRVIIVIFRDKKVFEAALILQFSEYLKSFSICSALCLKKINFIIIK